MDHLIYVSIVIVFVLCLHNYTMISTNIANNLMIFEFIILIISNIMNVKIVSDSVILVIIESIGMICSFISNINIMVEASKKLRKMMRQGHTQMAIRKNFQNSSNNYNCSNVNSIHYSLNAIAIKRTGMEGFNVNAFDLEQTHLVVVLFHAFDITHHGFANELKTRALIICSDFLMKYAFGNAIDCDTTIIYEENNNQLLGALCRHFGEKMMVVNLLHIGKFWRQLLNWEYYGTFVFFLKKYINCIT